MKWGTLLQQEVDSIDVVATACMQQRCPSLLVFALHLALLKNVQQGHRKSGASSSSELNIKAKCAGFPHNVRSFAHQTCTKERFHDEVESLLCTKVSGTQDRCQRFPERVQTVLEEVYILLADPSPRRKQLFRFETEAQLVCMAMNTLRRFQQRAKSCLRSSV